MIPWILLALIACVASAAKVLSVSRLAQQTDSRHLVLAARIAVGILMLPVLLAQDRPVPDAPAFWWVTIATALLTAVASLLLTEAIKRGELSVVMPIQAAIPAMMLIVLLIIHREMPKAMSIVLTLIACLGIAFVLREQARAKLDASNDREGGLRYPMFSLGAAMIFGLTTVLDRTAVGAVPNGALMYTGWWNILSTGIMLLSLLYRRRKGQKKEREQRPKDWLRKQIIVIAAYTVTSLVAFIGQQYAVQLSLKVNAGVVAVKTLVMLHLPLVFVTDLLLSRRRPPARAIIAGGLTMAAGLALAYSLA